MTSMEGERYQLVTKWLLRHMRDQTEFFTNANLEVYGKLLCCVAGADGVLAPDEREWIIGYRAVFGAPEKVLEMLKTYDPTSDDWKTELEKNRKYIDMCKLPLIYDAFQAAAADDELHEDERKAISKLGLDIGVDEKIIAEMAQICQEEMELKKERTALLFPLGVDETIRQAKKDEK